MQFTVPPDTRVYLKIGITDLRLAYEGLSHLVVKVIKSEPTSGHLPLAEIIVFDFNLSRGRDSPERFIPEDWGGALQSDGYELYASLARERPRITRLRVLIARNSCLAPHHPR